MEKNTSLFTESVKKLCGYVVQNYTIVNIFNNISQNFVSELPVTVCRSANLKLQLNWIGSFTAIATCFIAAVGLTSTLLALFIFSHKNCDAVTFIYHRAINFADGVYMIFILERSLNTLLQDISSKSLAWMTFDSIFSSKLDFALTDFVEWIVAWISIERASIFFPSVITTINRKSVTCVVIAFSLMISVSMNIPNGIAFSTYSIVRNNTTVYSIAANTFGKSSKYQEFLSIRDVIFVLRAVLILLGSFITVISIVLFSRRKRKLANAVGPDSITRSHLIAQIKTNQSLCALQLCEAIPLIIFCCITAARHSVIVILKPVEDYMVLEYHDAIQKISDQKYSLELEFAKALLGRTAHAIHFFLYILFAPKIRNVTGEVFREFKHVIRGKKQNSKLLRLIVFR